MKKQLTFLLLVALLCASCASINEFTINIQKPAKVSFPNEVSTIVVANNSGDQPKGVNHKAYNYTQEIGDIEISAEGLGDFLVERLTDNLVESKAFEGVFLSADLPRNNRSFLEIRDLERPQVDSILKKYNANLLFTLDRYAALLSTDVENIGDGVVRKFYTVRTYADFSIYDEFGEKREVPISYRDTLYWSEYSQGRYIISDPLPSFEETLQGAVAYAADESAKSLTPQWLEVQRWVYANATTEMRHANVNFNSKRWADARDIWMNLYEKESNPTKKARLASNIALTYELSDDLDVALKWAKDAESSLLALGKRDADEQRAIYYVEELEARILDFKLLDLQNQ